MTDLTVILGPRVPAFDQPPLTGIARPGIGYIIEVGDVTLTFVWEDDPPTLQFGLSQTPPGVTMTDAYKTAMAVWLGAHAHTKSVEL